MSLAVLVAGFPDPVGWATDTVKDAVAGAAGQGFELVLGGVTRWVLDAVVWVVGRVFEFFLTAADPNVQADWFVGGDGPYATTLGIGAVLLVGFLLIGITQGVLAGDVAGMARRVGFELPMAVLGMVGLVTLTQALVTLTDGLSHGLFERFGEDARQFSAAVASLSSLSGAGGPGYVVLLLGLVSVLAGVVLIAELVIRASLIYIVVALAPMVFAAQLWPALRGTGRKLLELLVALIVSKLVIAVALAVAAAAAVGAGSGGEVTALPRPEVVAPDPGGSVTQAVGLLLAATTAFGVAAFSPLLVARLLPLTEAAAVASGVRGGPVRAGQQALSASYYTQMFGRSRLTSLASSGAAVGASVAAGPAVAGVAVAGQAATAPTKTGTTAASSAATATTSSTNPDAGATRTRRPDRYRGPRNGGDGDA